MKKKQLVCSALAAAMMLSTAAPGASAARFSDSNGHWGESSIDRWSNSGVIVGTDSAFNPNGAITRGEMATILSEMLGLEQRANNTYPDLNGGWYTDAMLKCAAAGIMTGDDHGQMRPYDNVTGAEIAVILSKALDLSSSRANYPTSRTGYVKPWAQGYVDAIASRGIAVGNDGTTFEPMQDTSRAAFVTMLDRAVDTYISSPGTYTATGLTIVNTDGTVTLKGSPTSIDITQSSTGGTVKLDHTNVSGTIKLQGSRVRLTASHATLDGDIQVSGNGSTISLDGSTNAGVVQLSSDAGSSTITVGSDARAGSIMSDASSTTVNVSGSVNNIQFDRNAASSGVSVRNGARVENLTSSANDVTVSGSGTLRRADIYGTNNRVTTPNTVVSRASNTTSSTARNRTYANPRRRSSSDRYDVDFYYNDGSRNIYASERVYSGDRVSNPGEPTRTGYVFDKWRYERYYYGYDRYDYDYDYRYDWDYDWDDWYKSSDWKWDSGEEAYYNRTADLYYDDDGDYYFTIVRGYRSRLSRSEVRSRYGKYYNWGYWYDSSDWKWSSKWDAYYNSDADLYYDDDDDQYFIVVSGRRRNLSSSDVHDRYGKYYYGDSWYDRGDWSWSSSWGAYYNSIAKIYYDDDDDYFFTTSGGSRNRLTDSEARSRLNRYYNGYYDDRYYDRYYYNYRRGETFSFSDRIYGDVDLYAQWTECTDTSSASDLMDNSFWSNAKSIVALRDSITVQSLNVPSGKKLYLPSGVTLSVVDGSYTGTVYGPGRINVNSTNTPVDDAAKKFTDALGIKDDKVSASISGSTYTIEFKDNYSVSEVSAQLQSAAKDLWDAAQAANCTLWIGDKKCDSYQDILTAIGANGTAPAAYAKLMGSVGAVFAAEADTSAKKVSDLESVTLTLKDASNNVKGTYTVKISYPGVVTEDVVLDAFNSALVKTGGKVSADNLKAALTAAINKAGDAVEVKIGDTKLSSASDIPATFAGYTVEVKIGSKSVTVNLVGAPATEMDVVKAFNDALVTTGGKATVDDVKAALQAALDEAGTAEGAVEIFVGGVKVTSSNISIAGTSVAVKIGSTTITVELGGESGAVTDVDVKKAFQDALTTTGDKATVADVKTALRAALTKADGAVAIKIGENISITSEDGLSVLDNLEGSVTINFGAESVTVSIAPATSEAPSEPVTPEAPSEPAAVEEDEAAEQEKREAEAAAAKKEAEDQAKADLSKLFDSKMSTEALNKAIDDARAVVADLSYEVGVDESVEDDKKIVIVSVVKLDFSVSVEVTDYVDPNALIVDPEPEPAVEPEKEPVVEPEKEPVVEPEKEPVVEPEKEPVVEPEKDPVVEPDKEEAGEPEKDSVVGSDKEEAGEPEKDPVIEPEKEQAEEPEKDPVVEPETKATGEGDVEPEDSSVVAE